MQALSTRLNDNIAIAKEAIERLEACRPLLPDPDVLREEALRLRLASIQIGYLAQDVSYHLMEVRSKEDRKKKAANDDS